MNFWRVKEQHKSNCIAVNDEHFNAIVEFDERDAAFRYYTNACNNNYYTVLEEKVDDKWEYRAASCTPQKSEDFSIDGIDCNLFKPAKTAKRATCVEYAKDTKETLKTAIKGFKRAPKLCVIQVDNDPASCSYIKGKVKDCAEVGINCEHVHLENITEDDLLAVIDEKNKDASVDGIIVQLPLPKGFDVKKIQDNIYLEKDVDGFNSNSKFSPCTPKGVMDYLEAINIPVEGRTCMVVGRSEIVGKPLVNMLIEKGATVINCNSKTPKHTLLTFALSSDIFISAIGKPNYFDEKYFINQVIIDVGINRDENGKLCGDVLARAKEKVDIATPVPNGVGLLTRVALLVNTVEAYKMKN